MHAPRAHDVMTCGTRQTGPEMARGARLGRPWQPSSIGLAQLSSAQLMVFGSALSSIAGVSHPNALPGCFALRPITRARGKAEKGKWRYRVLTNLELIFAYEATTTKFFRIFFFCILGGRGNPGAPLETKEKARKKKLGSGEFFSPLAWR